MARQQLGFCYVELRVKPPRYVRVLAVASLDKQGTAARDGALCAAALEQLQASELYEILDADADGAMTKRRERFGDSGRGLFVVGAVEDGVEDLQHEVPRYRAFIAMRG
jgi:hypothetical protein